MKIPLNQIKPDPNQPRKIIDQRAVENLAKNMKVEGLIHAIEVDANYMIIVGEIRYRAALLLGWKEIEANVNKTPLTPYERFRRQMSENLQQSGAKRGGQPMNAVDTAKAWARLYELKTGKGYEPGSHPLIESDTPGGRQMKGVFLTIAEEVGVTKENVWQYLQLLDQPKYVLADLLRGRPRTYYREAEKAPKEIRETIKKKIAKGEYKDREEIIKDVAIAKKVPTLQPLIQARQQDKESKEANRILNAISTLSLALADIPLTKIAAGELKIIRNQLEWMKEKIEIYLLSQQNERA